MQPSVQLEPDGDDSQTYIVTTSTKPKNQNDRGAALRDAQQAELDLRYGEPGKEPGIKPTAENIALFLVAYPVPVEPSYPTGRTQGETSPIACGSLRDLGEGYMEIKRMYAVPSVRGSGAALAVLHALEHYAHTTGIKALKLETGDRQQDAMRFYEKHGYVSIPRFGHYAHIPWSNCYEKLLS